MLADDPPETGEADMVRLIWKVSMVERLVDVMDANGAVLHTYPVAIKDSDPGAGDAEYEKKAMQAAANSELVPHDELGGLTTRMHVSRGGALAPYGDVRATLSETAQSLEQAVRERAYFLWERDGRPHGQSEECWTRAREEHLRERAYVLWQQQGCPDGRADEHWHQTCAFETS
ncbi:MAG TPA: DUF2934 domain-containing protein [Candidatus Limnocylindria bacterium]|nr:DUF2934 domain-containing protein [Candidatus Limnocylindria bacterium]